MPHTPCDVCYDTMSAEAVPPTPTPFAQFPLPLSAAHSFHALTAAITLERVGKGRAVAVLIREQEDGCVPIVRTTARYDTPAQPFPDAVRALAETICTISGAMAFNNGMAEVYDRSYRSMRSHSDMALDLKLASHIAIVTVYDVPPSPDAMRRLVICNKETLEETTLPLPPDTVTLFSVADNRRFRHKIVAGPSMADIQWLGITLRTSQTHVHFRHGVPHIGDVELTAATAEQERELLLQRRAENDAVAFIYPSVAFTLSKSDMLPLLRLGKTKHT